MATTYEKIASVTVGSGGAANIEFTSIPGTFDDLIVLHSLRGTASGDNVGCRYRLNGDTGSTKYSWRDLRGTGSSVSSGAAAAGTIAYLYAGEASAASNTANTFANGSIYFPNYAGSTNKSSSSDLVSENNATLAYTAFVANLWADTSAITSITIYPGSGNWAQYSTAVLYGIKKS